jgi:hypothetical protein
MSTKHCTDPIHRQCMPSHLSPAVGPSSTQPRIQCTQLSIPCCTDPMHKPHMSRHPQEQACLSLIPQHIRSMLQSTGHCTALKCTSSRSWLHLSQECLWQLQRHRPSSWAALQGLDTDPHHTSGMIRHSTRHCIAQAHTLCSWPHPLDHTMSSWADQHLLETDRQGMSSKRGWTPHYIAQRHIQCTYSHHLTPVCSWLSPQGKVHRKRLMLS